MSGPSTAEQTALQFAGYREVWRLPAPSEGKIQELYLASDGRSVAYRSTTTVTIAEQNGRRRRLPSPVGEIVAPMPDLQVWLSKPLGEAGKVRAWGPDGQMRWEVDAPAGPINVGGPSGQVIVISQGTPTNGPGTRKTALFDPDGRPGWQTDQFGGEVSFDAAGEFLVWDVAQRSWHVLAPSGQLRHSGTVEGARQRPYLLSADGRYVIDQESGILESLDRRPPGQKPAGPALIQGPGPFVASNGRDLYLFLRYLGEFSRLQAIRSDGSVLWTIPAPDYRAVLIPPDGKVVLVAGTAGLQSLDGTTGAIRETLTGVKQVHLSPDGGHLLIQLTDQFVILSRP